MHANHIEREINHELRTGHEQAGTPERRAERKTPFGGPERRIQLPNLKQPHGRVVAVGHDREADISSRLALALRPLNEPLETFDGRRRRRDEARHFLGCQQRQQRGRITHAQLAQRDALRLQNRQLRLPIRLTVAVALVVAPWSTGMSAWSLVGMWVAISSPLPCERFVVRVRSTPCPRRTRRST